jgi:hypothetical protein
MLEGRRSKPERRWRRRPRGRRPWWWSDGLMRAKAPRMSGLGGSSSPRVVQGLSLLLLAFMYLLLNDFCCKYMLNLCEVLNMICIMNEHDIIIYNYVYVYYDCMCLYVNLCICLYVIYDCLYTCM